MDLSCLVSWSSLLKLQLSTCHIIWSPSHCICYFPCLEYLPILSGSLNTIYFSKFSLSSTSFMKPSLIIFPSIMISLFPLNAPLLLSLTYLILYLVTFLFLCVKYLSPQLCLNSLEGGNYVSNFSYSPQCPVQVLKNNILQLTWIKIYVYRIVFVISSA